MTLGTRLGPYEVLSLLGAGGMGEVYRAKDSTLKREVALKVLPADVAKDRERLARFQREAEVLASLNHPHIAQIYGLERAGDTFALVMELVEGEDLAQRIARGAIPLDETLPIARQIAEALEAAHECGIVHRDLKPANIKVRSDGTVKVLDFGLAKAVDPAAGSSATAMHLMNSPTITSPAMTMHGIILGTAAYMAPEQAKGKAVDKRADIWAFGVVLYEMLTGMKAFDGEDITDMIAAVVTRDPDWTKLPAETAPAIIRLLQRCLVKNPRNRLPDMAVARLDIDEALAAPAGSAAVPAATGRRIATAVWRERLAWAMVAIAGVAGLVVVTRSAPTALLPSPVQFSLAPAIDARFSGRGTGTFALTPDGQFLVYAAQDPVGLPALWLHSFREGTARALPNTAAALNPFWSPDGRSIAFQVGDQAGGKLQRVDVVTGAAQTICNCVGGHGTWNRDDVILIANRVIHRVPARGGTPEPVTTLDETRGDLSHVRPHFLPDGRRFLFSAVNRDISKSTLQLGELGSTETRMISDLVAGAEYVAPGYLVYAVDGRLMARPFDAAAAAWTGDATVISNSVRQRALGFASFSASSAGGTLVYDATDLTAETDLVWVNRDGRSAGTFATVDGLHTMWLAANDRLAAVELLTGMRAAGTWLLDSARGTRTRFTFESSDAQGHPVWSPDLSQIVYFIGQPGAATTLMLKAASGTRDAEPLLPADTQGHTRVATDWSADGRLVVFEESSPTASSDLRYVRLDGDRRPVTILHSPFPERQGQLSPDGRYLAYVSSESGREEVYVVTFPDAAERWPISSSGGTTPRWRHDGRELMFVDAQGMLMGVAVPPGDTFRPDVPKPLFPLGAVPSDGWNYAIARDGRLLVARPAERATGAALKVAMNWPQLLRSAADPR